MLSRRMAICGALSIAAEILGVSDPKAAPDPNADTPQGALLAGLEASGVEVQQHFVGAHPSLDMTLDQIKFISEIPLLQGLGMLNPDLNQTYINLHPFSLSNTFAVMCAQTLVKNAFDTEKSLNSLYALALLRFADDYGNDQKKPIFSFSFNRALYKRINWDHLDGVKFMKIAPNFRFSPWVEEKVAREMFG